jgi:catechol-2,3-dioxygenase
MQIQELGHVVLYVTDINRMADFYRDTLGFPEIARDTFTALFSGGRTHHELLLIQTGRPHDGEGLSEPGLPRRPAPGLYHIGFKIGDGPEVIKEALTHLQEEGVAIIGTADHTVTHSLYILDPDGNELELYADVSDIWKTNPGAIMAPVKPLNLG